jgi:hypothetical protein
MSNKFNLYVGKAGHLHVMSEFLMRGWNVAMPEVDTGDDILVVEDENDTFYRVQVKTAQATTRKDGYSFQVNIPLYQLKEYDANAYFVFAIRHVAAWGDMLLIPQTDMYGLHRQNLIGSEVGNHLMLYFSVKESQIICSKTDFTPYLNNFNDFPIVEH